MSEKLIIIIVGLAIFTIMYVTESIKKIFMVKYQTECTKKSLEKVDGKFIKEMVKEGMNK